MPADNIQYRQFIDEDELYTMLEKLSRMHRKTEIAMKLLKSITGVDFNIHIKTNTNINFNNGTNFLAYGSNLAHIAACFNRLDLLECFVNLGGNINTVNSLLETPLHVAILFGNMHIAHYMLNELDIKEPMKPARSYSPNTFAKDNKGNTPLHLMMLPPKKDIEIYIKNLKKMLKFIRDVNVANSAGNTPAHIAALHSNHYALAELLTSGMLDLRKKNNEGISVFTALTQEPSGKVFDCFVQELVTKSQNSNTLIDLKNDDGNNLLSCCILRESLTSIKLILKKWQDDKCLTKMLAEKNDNDHTPLDIAVVTFKSGIVKTLTELSLDKTLVENSLIKFLTAIERKKNHPPKATYVIANNLLDHAPLLDIKNNWNILLYVARIKLPKYIVQLVLNHQDNGAPVSSQVKFLLVQEGKDSPLHVAAKHNNTQTFLLLLEEYGQHITTDTTANANNMLKLNSTGADSLNLMQIALQNNNEDIFIALMHKVGVREILNGFFTTEDSDNLVFLTLAERNFALCRKLLSFICCEQNMDVHHDEIRKFFKQVGKNGRTVAHMATCNDSCNIFPMIYDACPDIIHIKNNDDCTPIELLIKNGAINALQHIAKQDESILPKWALDNAERTNELIANTDNIEIASLLSSTREQEQKLLQKIFTTILKNGNEKSLQQAIDLHPELLNVQLIAEDDDAIQMSALQISVNVGNLDLITKLLKLRVNVNFQDANGNTAMHTAFMRTGDNIEIIRHLVNSNINASLRNANGLSAVELSISNGSMDILQTMLSKCQFTQLPCINMESLRTGLCMMDSKQDAHSLLILATPKQDNVQSTINQQLIDNVKKENLALSRFLCFQKGLSFAVKNEHGLFGSFLGLWHYAVNACEWYFGKHSRPDIKDAINMNNVDEQSSRPAVLTMQQKSLHDCQEAFSKKIFEKNTEKEARHGA
ncbi:hypothetical protein CAXC1_210004 [Candidatus Xenohaliotis californiensis]|uniref:Ankyrin repeat protein n=1 Tax=Candidatus Xenohaliotis californiensis TaxID=84677 RepID=A0ABP0EVJ6_9RICK|nr:hypothetical protein CAXC1_210004 [Candidatus Xenohaliotis californiensis]